MGNARQNERRKLYRKAAQAYGGLDGVMEDILELKAIFEPTHPEMANTLQIALEAALVSQSMVEAFCTQAWEKDGKSIMVYYSE